MENCRLIEDQVCHLPNLGATFLEASRLNRGEIMLALEEVDLAAIARQVVTQHSSIASGHTISCTIEQCEQPYLVLGDSARLQQIIANLVDNAIKYIPLGGPIPLWLRRRPKLEDRECTETCVE